MDRVEIDHIVDQWMALITMVIRATRMQNISSGDPVDFGQAPRIIGRMVSRRAPKRTSPYEDSRPGTIRLVVDLPAEDHARFKAISALHRTTILHEVSAFLAAQIAQPDELLSRRLLAAETSES